MAKPSFNLSTWVSRFVQLGMVALLIPLVVGLLIGVLRQLHLVRVSGAEAREWVNRGFLTYLIIHLVLYRPTGLFRASHKIFSALAVWLFGGQVSSVEDAGSGGRGRRGRAKPAKRSKETKMDRSAREDGPSSSSAPSTLVAFSPYVIPLFTLLVCVLGWMARQRWNHTYVEGPVCFLVALTLAFHWFMTADELQEQREQWRIETYLLAVGLIFMLTLVISAACLPWAVPQFSFSRALSVGFSASQEMYSTLIKRLFF